MTKEEDAAAEAMGMGARPEADDPADPAAEDLELAEAGEEEEQPAAVEQEEMVTDEEAEAAEDAAPAEDAAADEVTADVEAEVEAEAAAEADSTPAEDPGRSPNAGGGADGAEVPGELEPEPEPELEPEAEAVELTDEKEAKQAEEIAAGLGLEGTPEEDAAAIKMQAVQRGKHDRARVEELKKEKAAAADPDALSAEATAARTEAKKNSVFAMLANSIGQKPGTPRNKYAERVNSATDSRIDSVKNPPPPKSLGLSGIPEAPAPPSESTAADAPAAPPPRVVPAPAAAAANQESLFKNLHVAELQTLLQTMGLDPSGGKYELLGRLQDTLEMRGSGSGSGAGAGSGAPPMEMRQPELRRDQLGREMPAWQAQQ